MLEKGPSHIQAWVGNILGKKEHAPLIPLQEWIYRQVKGGRITPLKTKDITLSMKVLVGFVFKNAENRELFLGYGSRLRGLWLKKEVAKLETQLPPSECSCGCRPILAPTKWTHKYPNIQRLIDDCPSFDLGL